jgi:ATP/ADP translocase
MNGKKNSVLRPDLMSPIRKTSLLYVRSDLFARLMPQLLFVIVYESESNRQRDMKFLSFIFHLNYTSLSLAPTF